MYTWMYKLIIYVTFKKIYFFVINTECIIPSLKSKIKTTKTDKKSFSVIMDHSFSGTDFFFKV